MLRDVLSAMVCDVLLAMARDVLLAMLCRDVQRCWQRCATVLTMLAKMCHNVGDVGEVMP